MLDPLPPGLQSVLAGSAAAGAASGWVEPRECVFVDNPSQWPRHKLLGKFLNASTKVTDAECKSMVTFADQLRILRSLTGWQLFYKNGVIDNTARKRMTALLTLLFLGVEPSLVRSGAII